MKATVVAYFKSLSWHSLEGSDDNYEGLNIAGSVEIQQGTSLILTSPHFSVILLAVT
jgi:hypothetical protein